jgi:hypothetical protein
VKRNSRRLQEKVTQALRKSKVTCLNITVLVIIALMYHSTIMICYPLKRHLNSRRVQGLHPKTKTAKPTLKENQLPKQKRRVSAITPPLRSTGPLLQILPTPLQIPTREQRVNLQQRVAVCEEWICRNHKVQQEFHRICPASRNRLDHLREPDEANKATHNGRAVQRRRV